jgi:hypothetical protein
MITDPQTAAPPRAYDDDDAGTFVDVDAGAVGPGDETDDDVDAGDEDLDDEDLDDEDDLDEDDLDEDDDDEEVV